MVEVVEVPAWRCRWSDPGQVDTGLRRCWRARGRPARVAASLPQPDPVPCRRSWPCRGASEASDGTGELSSQNLFGLWLNWEWH